MTLSAAVYNFGRRRCQPFCFEVFLAASGVSDQGVWGVYGCAFSWQFQWHYWRPRPTPAASDIAVFSHGVLVLAMWFAVSQKEHTSVVTTVYCQIFPQCREKRTKRLIFIAGVNDTAENCSPMSMTPLINFLQVSPTQCFQCQQTYTWIWKLSKNSVKCSQLSP
jgi:hypothetical protein